MHRNSSKIVSWTVLAIALAAGGSLGAQEPTRAGSRFVPHVSAAAAVDLRNGESRYPDMYMGFANLDWSTAVPGLGVRLEGLYAARSRNDRLYPQDCGPLCGSGGAGTALYSMKVSAKGALLGATYELVRQGHLRPYVVGGAGAIQTRDQSVTGTVFLCPIEVTCAMRNSASAVTVTDDRPVSAAAHIGAGAVYTWRWISVVGEARYFAVSNGISRGLNGALPLSLGLRF
jgi:hypothetical protein